MSEKSIIAGPGRPEKFGPVHIRFFKKIVGKMGLIRGRDFLLQNGIKINNKVRKLEISVPTLSKYVRRSDELTGEGVVLSKGRHFPKNLQMPEETEKVTEVRRGPGRPKKVGTIIKVGSGRGPGRPKKSA